MRHLTCFLWALEACRQILGRCIGWIEYISRDFSYGLICSGSCAQYTVKDKSVKKMVDN
jgi:hypothetical protein